MGEVYLAHDTKLDREVAIKALPEELSADPERLERLRREARAVAGLDHPNIVTIHSIEEYESRAYIVMQRIEGEALDRKIPARGLEEGDLLDYALQICTALIAAHKRGLIHRDLKPSNIMVTTAGEIKVLDFGLAKQGPRAVRTGTWTAPSPAPSPTLTREGAILGTAPYMSPEQAQGAVLDRRSDIFSLGVVFYELSTGRRPFAGANTAALVASILKEVPEPITRTRADIGEEFSNLVDRCLEKDPEQRFQSVEEIVATLQELIDARSESRKQRAQSQLSTATLPPGATVSLSNGDAQSPVNRGRRSPLAWLLWVGIALLLGLGIWWYDNRERLAGEAPLPNPTSAASSVAVVPFADLSPEQDQAYFADGMTEEILQALGSIDGLKVPARSSVFALKDKPLDVREIGRRLGVENVVEGSVRKSGDRVRIAAQLIQVSDGFELWSESFDRDLEDIFDVQDEIARNIAGQLRLSLSPSSLPASQQGGTSNTEAYDYYLRAHEFHDRGGNENHEYAIELYGKAIDIDPNYALAYAGLAHSHAYLYGNRGGSPQDLEAADRASEEALRLAPGQGAVQLARAEYLEQAGKQDRAEKAYQEALRLGPNNPETYHSFGVFLFRLGEYERSAELWEKAVELDPKFRQPLGLLSQVYKDLGWEEKSEAAFEQSVRVSEEYLELHPDDHRTRLYLGTNFLQRGYRDQAFEVAERALNFSTTDTTHLYNVGCFYSLAEEPDLALEALERSVAAGYNQIDWFMHDSDLDNIRHDPRFDALLKTMNDRIAERQSP